MLRCMKGEEIAHGTFMPKKWSLKAVWSVYNQPSISYHRPTPSQITEFLHRRRCFVMQEKTVVQNVKLREGLICEAKD